MLSENGIGEADPFSLSIKLSNKIQKNSQIPLPFFPTLRYVVLAGQMNIERQAPYLLNN